MAIGDKRNQKTLPGLPSWPASRATRICIDIFAGSSELRGQIEAGVPTRDIARSWEPAVAEFVTLRERFLLY